MHTAFSLGFIWGVFRLDRCDYTVCVSPFYTVLYCTFSGGLAQVLRPPMAMPYRVKSPKLETYDVVGDPVSDFAVSGPYTSLTSEMTNAESPLPGLV